MTRWIKNFCLSFLLIGNLSGCSSLLYHPSRTLFLNAAKLGHPPREVRFASLDGTELNGWYFRTPLRKNPKGLLVFFHGNGENISTHFAQLYWILEEGYNFFIFDYQGYGRSQGKPSPRKTVKDGKAALCWSFLQKPTVPLIVFGQSLGGAVALRTVSEVKGQIPVAYLVVDSTFLSYRAVAREILSRHWLTWILQPLATLTLSDRYAPGNRVAAISPIPLLVIHGDQDQTVSFRLGEKLFNKAGEPKEFLKIPGGRHIDVFARHNGRYRKELLKRLNRIDRRRVAAENLRVLEAARNFCDGGKTYSHSRARRP